MADDHHEHDHGSVLSETQIRVRALESALIAQGYVDPAALDALVETYETKVGPHNGADRRARLRRPPGRAHGRAREHARDPQHGRLHALLVLPVAGPGPAAGLVQERALPLAGGVRAARGAGRLRRHAARADRDPRLGLDRRGPLPRRP